MIIPAAGLGTRLHAAGPKVLLPVNGRAMVDYLLEMYAPVVSRFIVVVHPSFEVPVRAHFRNRSHAISFVRQETPSGMLDAILVALDRVNDTDPDRVWITWCDQIAIHPETVRSLKRLSDECPQTALIFPTARRRRPYVHLVRDAGGRIVDVLHRREGDEMPDIGENDMGLFSLSRDTYARELKAFSCEAGRASKTRERNFLPFIPWLAARGGKVDTFPCRDEREAIGINTLADLREIERYLVEYQEGGSAHDAQRW